MRRLTSVVVFLAVLLLLAGIALAERLVTPEEHRKPEDDRRC